ncbi:hypothetical protein [Rhodococcus pyridinivorans]
MNETPPHPFIPEEPSYEISFEIESGTEDARPSQDGLSVYRKKEEHALIELDFILRIICALDPLAHADPQMRRYSAEAGVAFIDERRESIKRWIADVRTARAQRTDTAEDL